jgi:hypothetical protein
LEESIEAGCYPFVAQFPNASDVMHLDLFVYFAADTAGFSQFGAGSESDQGSYHISVVLVPSLECESAFGPVLIEIKADQTICLSSLPLDKK